MNTGIRGALQHPQAHGRRQPLPLRERYAQKDIIRIMAAHNIPYIATASIGYPADLIRKVKRAKEKKGMKFILIFHPAQQGGAIPRR